jgi:hypothetical protein
LVETAATVAVKAALDAPAAIVTLAGTVALELLLERATANPPAGAGALSPTLQAEVPGALTLAGAHERLLRPPCVPMVMVPPVPDEEIVFPAALEVPAALTPTGVEPAAADEVMLNAAVARRPSPITLLFMPNTTQVVLPLALEHDTFFPAAVAAPPAVTLTAVMTEDE